MRQARPDLFVTSVRASPVAPKGAPFPTRLIAGLGALALLVAGVFSWFASVQPDGLEWSIARTTGHPELPATESALHASLSAIQKKLALFEDYKFTLYAKPDTPDIATSSGAGKVAKQVWPAVDAGTSLAGIIGGAATLTLVLGLGYLLRRRKSRGAL